MNLTAQRSSVLSMLIAGATVVIVFAGLRTASGIFNQFFLATFILLISLPIWRWLRQKGMATWLANTLVIAGVVIGTAALVILLGASLARLAAKLPEYAESSAELRTNVRAWLTTTFGLVGDDILALFDLFEPAGLLRAIAGFLLSAVPVATSLFFTLFIFAFLLIDAEAFPKRMRRVLGPDSTMLQRMSAFGQGMGDMIRIRSGLGLFQAGSNLVLFLVLGVDFAFMWAVLSFFGSFIPYLGYWLALIPPLIVTLLKFGMQRALILFVIFHLINGFTENVLAPRFLSRGLNISAVATFLSVIVWSWVLGPLGALLGVPLTIAIKMLILEGNAETRWLAAAIGGDSALDESTGTGDPPDEDEGEPA